MKNVFFFAIATFLFVGVTTANASCGDPIFDASLPPVQIGTEMCGNGDPMKNVNSWGLSGYDTPQIKRGQTVTDEAGFKDTCPDWFNLGMGTCFNIFGTEHYRNGMKATAQQAKTQGVLSQFKGLTYWATAR